MNKSGQTLIEFSVLALMIIALIPSASLLLLNHWNRIDCHARTFKNGMRRLKSVHAPDNQESLEEVLQCKNIRVHLTLKTLEAIDQE